jgi:hypothetical protein
MSPIELKCGHPRSVAGGGPLPFRRAPGSARRFRHYELLDCLLDLFKAAGSILELCFELRSCDVLGFNPRKAILLKFTIHSALSLVCSWFHEKIAERRNFFENLFGLLIRLPGARAERAPA